MYKRQGKIIAVGLNYREHADEGGVATPATPVLFTKWPNCLIADGDAIVIPDGVRQVDWEAELAVVIGRTARGVTVEEALEYVGGYTVLNDVTDREAQFAEEMCIRDSLTATAATLSGERRTTRVSVRGCLDIRFRSHGVRQRADLLDLDADRVTGLEESRRLAKGAHSRRGSGRDQVPGVESDSGADERHEGCLLYTSRCV